MPDVRTRGRAYGRAANEPKPRSDAYTGLLLLSLLAQIAGAVFLFLDWHQYPDASPPEVRSVATAPAAPARRPSIRRRRSSLRPARSPRLILLRSTPASERGRIPPYRQRTARRMIHPAGRSAFDENRRSPPRVRVC